MNERLKVAVIDDDELAAESMSVLLVDAKMEPLLIPGGFSSVPSAVEQILTAANAAVCDHRLNPRGYASFFGAELVAHLYCKNFPAILVTQYSDIDNDVSIRKFRRRIPVMLSRDEADENTLPEGIAICREELKGSGLPSRRAWRSIIRLDFKATEGLEDVVDAVIPAWNPRTAVRFPTSLLPDDIRASVDKAEYGELDVHLFAYVNIGAENSRDLFFYGFEPAPVLREDDGLN